MTVMSVSRATIPTRAASSTVRLLRKLRLGVQSAVVVNLSDSTGDADTEWFRLITNALAARYPEYTVNYYSWSDGSDEYGVATVIQTGTGNPVGSGPPVLSFYNAAVAGKSPNYHTARISKMVGETQPDLTFINHGHNDNQTAYTANNIASIQSKMLALTHSILLEAPASSILIMSQNPNWGQQLVTSEVTSQIYMEVAEMCGYGFVDILRVFRDAGATIGPSTYMTDDVHPSATGHILWSSALLRMCFPSRWEQLTEPGSMQPSGFLQPGLQLLANGDFSDFASPPTLPSWTATACTLAKDTTVFESDHGWSLRMTSSSAASSYITQTVDADMITTFRNRWITIAARMYIYGGSPATGIARLGIRPSTGVQISGHSTEMPERWFWKIHQMFIPEAATSLEARVYADIDSGGIAQIAVDRVIMTIGKLPRNML